MNFSKRFIKKRFAAIKKFENSRLGSELEKTKWYYKKTI